MKTASASGGGRKNLCIAFAIYINRAGKCGAGKNELDQTGLRPAVQAAAFAPRAGRTKAASATIAPSTPIKAR